MCWGCRNVHRAYCCNPAAFMPTPKRTHTSQTQHEGFLVYTLQIFQVVGTCLAHRSPKSWLQHSVLLYWKGWESFSAKKQPSLAWYREEFANTPMKAVVKETHQVCSETRVTKKRTISQSTFSSRITSSQSRPFTFPLGDHVSHPMGPFKPTPHTHNPFQQQPLS